MQNFWWMLQVEQDGFHTVKVLEGSSLITSVDMYRFFFQELQGDSDSMTLIESVPDGWWYSALLPKKIRVTSSFTNSNLPVARYAKSPMDGKRLCKKPNMLNQILKNTIMGLFRVHMLCWQTVQYWREW